MTLPTKILAILNLVVAVLLLFLAGNAYYKRKDMGDRLERLAKNAELEKRWYGEEAKEVAAQRNKQESEALALVRERDAWKASLGDKLGEIAYLGGRIDKEGKLEQNFGGRIKDIQDSVKVEEANLAAVNDQIKKQREQLARIYARYEEAVAARNLAVNGLNDVLEYLKRLEETAKQYAAQNQDMVKRIGDMEKARGE